MPSDRAAMLWGWLLLAIPATALALSAPRGELRARLERLPARADRLFIVGGVMFMAAARSYLPTFEVPAAVAVAATLSWCGGACVAYWKMTPSMRGWRTEHAAVLCFLGSVGLVTAVLLEARGVSGYARTTVMLVALAAAGTVSVAASRKLVGSGRSRS